MNRNIFIMLLVLVLVVFNVMSETVEFHLKTQTGQEAVHLTSDDVVGVVVLMHGYQGYLDEVDEIFKDLSVELIKNRIASYRFNFKGEGKREGYVITSTTESRVQEGENAIAYVNSYYKGDVPVGVLGFSLGGMTAIISSKKTHVSIPALVVWSSVDNPAYSIASTNEKKNKAMRDALEKGRAEYDEGWALTTITDTYIKGMIGYNVRPYLKEYKGAFLSVRGDNDYLPHAEKEWFEIMIASKKKAVIIRDADHIFNVFDKKNSKEREVIKVTKDWFVRYLIS